jgi:hypothetical protein
MVKLSLYLIKHVKGGGGGSKLNGSLFSAFDGSGWSDSRPDHFTPVEGAMRLGVAIAGLDAVAKEKISAPVWNRTSAT